jgi:hypothetical protein
MLPNWRLLQAGADVLIEVALARPRLPELRPSAGTACYRVARS